MGMPPEAPRRGPDGPRIPRLKEMGLTPHSLREDNHSQAARNNLDEMYRRIDAGVADRVLGCSDSRLIVPPGVTVARSISASTRPELGRTMLTTGFRLPRSNIVIVHEPCGGLKVKAGQAEEPFLTDREFSADHVGMNVVSEDPFIQGLSSGTDLITSSQRPTLVALQHHETGQLDILGILTPDGEGTYQRRVSRDGLPRDVVPEVFHPFLGSYDAAVARAREADPDFEVHQQTINPSVVLMTTQLFGNERFPDTLGHDPNTTFTVTIPTTPIDNITEQGIVRPLDQVHYAISEALKSEGDTTKPFGNLARGGTIVIEASNAWELTMISDELLAREHMREWLKKDYKNQVIVVRSEFGYVISAESLDDFQNRLLPKP